MYEKNTLYLNGNSFIFGRRSMAQARRGQEDTTINQLLVLCFRVVVAVEILLLLLLLRHGRGQPQRGDGQEVRQWQQCCRGRRGLRRPARSRLAVAASSVDVILTERDIEVPLPGLHLVPKSEEDEALRPHLPQLRLRVGRGTCRASRRRKHLCSA
uniref:Uncharacterized protein n=1 Tax=Triticum urartu TaxID=4572 RepID=A0A8R7TPA1_TRIUA